MSIEYLRVFFMFCVCLLHYLLYGLGYDPMDTSAPHYAQNATLMSLAQFGVTGFMFISGYFGMRFKGERLFRLWTECVFYSIVLCIVAVFFLGNHSIVSIVFSCFFPVSLGHWWFIRCYLLLYILSPLINRGIEQVPKKTLLLITLTFFLISYGAYCIPAQTGNNVFMLLTIYLIGRYLRLYPIKLLEARCKPIFIISTATLLLTTYISASYQGGGNGAIL